jgi:uncharacterized protein (TIRG00374 family)
VWQAGIGDVLEILHLFPVQTIVIVFLVNCTAVCAIGSWRWKIIIESQNYHKISFLKVLRAKLSGFMVSYLTPSVLVGGEPVRAYMIKEESDYGWEKSFASVIIDQAIYFFTLFLFMVAGFLFLIEHFSLPREIFYGFGSIAIVGIFILYLFYSRLINNSAKDGFFMFIIKTLRLDRIKFVRKKERNINKTEKIISQFFRNKRSAFAKAFLLAILEVAMLLIVIWIITSSLEAAANFMQSTSILFLLTSANLIPIPGSFGSFEAGLTFIFDLLNFGKSNGFAFSLIYRFINIALVVIGFFALIYFELRTVSHSFSIEAPKMLLDVHKFLVNLVYKK